MKKWKALKIKEDECDGRKNAHRRQHKIDKCN
jgi:hypothetical protein